MCIRDRSTCVGLRYGSLTFSLEVFLGSVESAAFLHTESVSYTHLFTRRNRSQENSANPGSLHTHESRPYKSRHPRRRRIGEGEGFVIPTRERSEAGGICCSQGADELRWNPTLGKGTTITRLGQRRSGRLPSDTLGVEIASRVGREFL